MCNQQTLRSTCAYVQSDKSLCWSLEYSMTDKLLTGHNLKFLSLKGGFQGPSESIRAKMPHFGNLKSRLNYVYLTKIYKGSDLTSVDNGLKVPRRTLSHLLSHLCHVTRKTVFVVRLISFRD